MHFQSLLFSDLTTSLLYDIIELREAVFVVEQTCYYQDADGLDKHPETRHLILWDEKHIAGYARLLAPDISYEGYSSIGRILNTVEYRGQGLGHKLVAEAVAQCLSLWPNHSIKIGAQAHLEKFYNQHGFVAVTEPYIEDGIPHISMIYQRS